MADKKMNEFAPATDATYIYAEAANGSQIKINKSDLVELFKSSIGFDTVLQDKGEAKDDLDTYKSTGYYGLNLFSNNNVHFPVNMTYGGLIVISCNQSRWVLQLAYSTQDNKIRTRTCNDMGIWQEWYER